MKTSYVLLPLVNLIVCIQIFGFQPDLNEKCYEKFYTEGIDYLQNEQFEMATLQFKAAKACEDKPKINDLDIKIVESQNGLIIALKKTRDSLSIANEKANSLINHFYFYANRFAVIKGKENENDYFINKNGDKVDKLGEWDYAGNFDRYGHARVLESTGKIKRQYLIDTLGNKYLVSYNLNGLNSKIQALVLTKSNLTEFPYEIIELKQLKILYLPYNNISQIPPEIENLENLETLDLFNNQLNEISSSIGNLPKLKVLNLGKNNFSKKEQEKIKERLPNCKIEFVP